ncbi:hypothetical protein GRF29_69g377215 [Pseudopithomyces chartarum]|uniref:Uncharacterized protein n=1 Tax=Pseudopithomyces chartarum TaxID=1892770 RepID=A0AAN6LXE6_9PLEO|nr:hypothetical protein GRF29_69g377215 [Pseudopithomyces chartarum]
MIEAYKDLKHGTHGKNSYESLKLERTASQLLHRMQETASEDSLESTRARVMANARTIYGPARYLDIITFGSTSSRKIAAAIVEHNPNGRSYVHCCSAKEDTRLAALEHLLVIQEDIMQRLMDREGIASNGWLPATAQAQHAQAFSSMTDLAASNPMLHGPYSHNPSNAPSKAPSPSFSSVPSTAPSQPQPVRPGRVQWIMGSES